jgi:tRNA modification GTPase
MRAPIDTIAAIATPPGRGGVGIVRVSGPATRAIAQALLGRLPAPRYATFLPFKDAAGNVIDRGLALFFPGPDSFTGEDVLELHGHGGPVVLDLVLRETLVGGARLARPGEFSERAFLNDKLDLAQAEAIADLIESGSEQAARSALRSLEGEFSRRVHALIEALIEARVFVEAAIDFPEEEIDFLSDPALVKRVDKLAADIAALKHATRQGCLLREGMTVALVGRPNVGKSSLLNALSQSDTAIVSEIPGTTRDVLRAEIQIDGLPVHVLDTAGLRATEDAIESEGVRRARAAIERAHRALVLLDDADPKQDAAALIDELPTGLPYTLIHTKIDLTGRLPALGTSEPVEIALSAQTGAGLDLLRAHLKACMGYEVVGAGTFVARRRHLDAIERAQAHVAAGRAQLVEAHAGELLAEELRAAQQALGEITGEFTADDLLGRIFASFCIGK